MVLGPVGLGYHESGDLIISHVLQLLFASILKLEIIVISVNASEIGLVHFLSLGGSSALVCISRVLVGVLAGREEQILIVTHALQDGPIRIEVNGLVPILSLRS